METFQFHLCRRNKQDLPDDGDLPIRAAESETEGKAKATPKQRGSTPDSIEDRFAKLENLVMGLAQSLTGVALNIEEERRAAANMGDLLAQDVAEKGKEKEEPLHKKTKKSEGLTISNQCKPAEEEPGTKSISDLAKAVNELGEDAPTEEAKVDNEVSKSQLRKKENLSRKTLHVPSHDGVRKVTKMTMNGPQKKGRKEKSREFTVKMTRMSEAVTLSYCQT